LLGELLGLGGSGVPKHFKDDRQFIEGETER
jgi:hypothetical protein